MIYRTILLLCGMSSVLSSMYPPYVENILDYYPGKEEEERKQKCCYQCPFGKDKYVINTQFKSDTCYITCLSLMERIPYSVTHFVYIDFEHECERGVYLRTDNNTWPSVDIYEKKKK